MVGIAKVVFADSEKNADMLYATGVFVPDPFLFVQVSGGKYVIVNDMEYSRVQRESSVDRVYSLREVLASKGRRIESSLDVAEACAVFLKRLKISRVNVPGSFPLGLAEELRKRRLVVVPGPDPFFPQRAVKTNTEVGKIGDVLRATEHGMQVAVDVLREASIRKKDGVLLLGAEPLTADRLRTFIQKAVIEKSCQASYTIVSCGTQAYDPHHRGEGPLLGNQPIVIDIFPRSESSGYYGDMTRTWVKGRASDRVRIVHHAVRRAQNLAISQLGPGRRGDGIHRLLVSSFEAWGFPTGVGSGRTYGFIHGTGHGLGLDIHESPSISNRYCRLAAGNVITVEPGLYYPDFGGVRIEDVVLIQENGVKVLSRFRKNLEIS